MLSFFIYVGVPYIFWTQVLDNVMKILFSLICVLILTFFMVSFSKQIFLIFIKSYLSIF